MLLISKGGVLLMDVMLQPDRVIYIGATISYRTYLLTITLCDVSFLVQIWLSLFLLQRDFRLLF